MLSVFDEFDSLDLSAGTLSVAEVASPIKTPEQIRAEWISDRRGFFTASSAHRLMGFEDKDELPKGAITYANEVAIERLTVYNPDRDTFKSAAMQWGNDAELEAIAAFTAQYGIEFTHTGGHQKFLKYGDYIGGTPDGICEAVRTGIEIKCPNSTTHFKYLQIENQADFKKVCTDYYWQVMQLMFLTGYASWFFVSYDPDFIDKRLRLKVLRVDYDATDIEKLLDRTHQANNLAKEIVTKLTGLGEG